MPSSSTLRWAALSLGVVAILGVWLYPTDEKRVKEAAATLINAANGSSAQLQSALEEHALPSVRISVAELAEPVEGREAIVEAVSQAKRLGPKLSFRLEAIEVSVEGNRARVTADLITMLQPELPELRRPRPSVAQFEKRAGHFRLVSAEVGAERLDQPEARP